MDFFLLNKDHVESCPKKQDLPTNRNGVVDATQAPNPYVFTEVSMNDSRIRRGVFIKMIYKENGHFNMYKGYIGEVREYCRGQDYAMVILHAMTNMKLLRVPIYHFVVIDY